jgi:hypothetical protein
MRLFNDQRVSATAPASGVSLTQVRIGNGTAGAIAWNLNVAVPVYVDEVSNTGVLKRSIAMPTTQVRRVKRTIYTQIYLCSSDLLC